MNRPHEGTKNTKSGERAGWIDLLFKRHTAFHALKTGFLLNLSQKQLKEESESHPNGPHALRKAALEQLKSGHLEFVAFALVVLSVVGQAEDLSRVDGFIEHPDELVRKAACACRFKLRRPNR